MISHYLHSDMAAGRWFELSLAEQMGNIGSEVSRARLAQGKDDKRFWAAAERALELFSLTLSDRRWLGRLKEIGRAREVFCDAVLGGKEYHSSLVDLQSYFDQFAIVVRRRQV